MRNMERRSFLGGAMGCLSTSSNRAVHQNLNAGKGYSGAGW
jgi:hypothetical protein